VYLRVCSDGTAEFQSSTPSNSDKAEAVSVRKTLNQDDFLRIKSAASDPKLTAVGPEYGTRYVIMDNSTQWTITVQRPRKPKIINVWEFSPDFAKTLKRPYPDALVNLGCNIQKIRADVSGESIPVDPECKRFLGSPSQAKP
jgi:hypothetical protein